MFSVIVGGIIDSTYKNRKDAEKRLEELRHSYFALVHPSNCMGIKENKIEKNT